MKDWFESFDWKLSKRSTLYPMENYHPYFAKFNPLLPERFILKFSKKNHTIFDPFHGSGAALYASLQNSRNAIGVDANPIANLITRVKFIKFTKKDKIITYVSRSLDPYRGFHVFMESIPEILKENPDTYIFIAGNKESHGYGAPSPEGNFKDIFYSKIKREIDESKIFFLDFLEYSSYIKVLQISTLHIYLTYPFVLSWSMLEAMSCGALVLGSNTKPVTEVIKNNDNGLLVDFFDSKMISKKITKVLKNNDNYNDLRLNARKTIIEKYDLENVCLPAHLNLIKKALQ